LDTYCFAAVPTPVAACTCQHAATASDHDVFFERKQPSDMKLPLRVPKKLDV